MRDCARICGILIANSCGGVNMHQGTALGPDALGAMLALFCAVRGIKPGKATAHLSPTPKEAFEAITMALRASANATSVDTIQHCLAPKG